MTLFGCWHQWKALNYEIPSTTMGSPKRLYHLELCSHVPWTANAAIIFKPSISDSVECGSGS